MTTPHAALEQFVRGACERADFSAAASEIMRVLGADVLRVIHARLRREELSAEVFSWFAEDLWVGLPAFAFRCSLRAWVFTLARNAGSRYLDRNLRRERAHVPLSQVPELLEHAAQIRTKTLADLPTDAERELARLRAELSEEDQLLLTLRIDREFDFREIAVVTLGIADAEPERVTREAARLRKRFELLKKRLRERWRVLRH